LNTQAVHVYMNVIELTFCLFRNLINTKYPPLSNEILISYLGAKVLWISLSQLFRYQGI